jgi:hypothetical protein
MLAVLGGLVVASLPLDFGFNSDEGSDGLLRALKILQRALPSEGK